MSTFNLVDQTNLFKINYYKKSENLYNSFNVTQGRIKKKYDFTGKQRFVSTPLSFSGGVGSGTLPTANAAKYEGAIITAKKVYATCEIDRETIKASANDKGAFVRATKESVQKTVESYMRNVSRILFGSGDGVLGAGYATGINVSGNGASGTPYVVQLDPDSFIEANFEEKDFVSIVVAGSAETTLLEITAVDVDNRLISLVGTSARLAALTGVGPFIATDEIAMQGSYNNDPIGLRAVRDESTSLYGIPVQRRWKMTTEAAGGSGINPDIMNKMCLDIEKTSGKIVDMIIVGYTQYRKILEFMEDQKVYNLPATNLKGNISFKGVEFMTSRGPIGIFVDRFVADDEIWFLNSKFIEVHHRPGFGWFDDDGTVFLRKSGSDEYEARYGGYYENYITPTFHGCITGLAK